MKLIERIAAVNGLRSNVLRFIKREKLHRSLNETRSSPHFPEFFNKKFSHVTGRPFPSHSDRNLASPSLFRKTH